MKSKKQIINHLLKVGYGSIAMAKICGYMVAMNMKGVNESVSIKIGDNSFADFIDWVNTQQIEKIDDIKVGDYLHHEIVGDFVVMEVGEDNNVIALCSDSRLNNIAFSNECEEILRRCTEEEIANLNNMLKKQEIAAFAKKICSSNV